MFAGNDQTSLRWINLVPSNIFKLGTIRRLVIWAAQRAEAQPRRVQWVKRSRAPTHETGTMDHRSIECEGKSNPSDWERIDLAQLVRCERAALQKRNGLRVPIRSQSRGLPRARAVIDFRQGALPPEAPTDF
jgi:hypothetical protein